MISYGSVCSGIEAASVAWEPLGFRPSWFSQFDPEHNYSRGPDFPFAVLAHHWPHVPNLGDMTLIAEAVRHGFIEAPDILVGGTPCQAFSVAGLRGGLSDGRGFLTLKFVELADEIDRQRPGNECVIVWENVPGVLSSKDNAFGCFLAGIAGESEPLVAPGGKWSNAGYVSGPSRAVAWRILDAQYFGVAQRRRRVFVVASARKGFDPAAVLFESEGVRRDTAPSREAGKAVAALTANGVGACGADDNQGQAGHLIPFRMVAFGEYSDDGSASTMKARDHKDATDLAVCVTGDVTHTLKAEGFDGSEDGTGRVSALTAQAGKGDAAPCVAVAHRDVMPTMVSGGSTEASHNQMSGHFREEYLAPTSNMQVRRLTPVECERLQGFPDGFTRLPGRTADGPRYKALGNSMAVPVMHWIGKRILGSI